jgi:hypothetical protein
MVYRHNNEVIITIGTYDMMKLQTYGSDPSRQTIYSSGPIGPTSRYAGGGLYASDWVISPGSPSVTRYRANFYRSTQFKLKLSHSSLNLVNGDAPLSVNSKIKDYLGGSGMIKNQFHINEKQYLGYYNNNQKIYVIEEIAISK